ncbi:hypothetical protein [Rhodococcus erythropolis]
MGDEHSSTAQASLLQQPASIDAIIGDLLKLRQGRGLADAERIKRAAHLQSLSTFDGPPHQQIQTFWQHVDSLEHVAEMVAPQTIEGRTPPPGREWHQLLETIFNREGARLTYIDRIRQVSPDLPRDFPHLSRYYQVTSATSSRWGAVATDAVRVLARSMLASAPIPNFVGTATPVSDPLPSATSSSVVLSVSAIHYSRLIVAHEHDAARIDRIPKRLSVLFKSETAVADIAEQRFGPGSNQIDAYIAEHRERKAQFVAQLAGGLHCREIYSKKELRSYLTSGAHGQTVRLKREHLYVNVLNWLDCLQKNRGYMVALTDEAVPLKYEVINGQTVVLHEAVGGNDRDRLNAIFITSVATGRQFLHDFDLIWDRTEANSRKTDNVVEWVNKLLEETE